MQLRRVLLRVMLVALGIAALAGILAVVTASGDVVWRIVGTAITTAAAVAVMFPFSLLMDKQKWRSGGLAGMAWTVGEYLLILTLIWAEHIFASSRIWEHIGLSLLWWTLCGLPLVIFLLFTGTDWLAVAARTGVGVGLMVLVLLEMGTWMRFSDWWSPADHSYGTAASLAGIGTLVLACLVNVGRRDRRWWRWGGVLVGTAAFVMAVIGIWCETSSDLGGVTVTALISVAALVGLANMVFMVPLLGFQTLVRWGTLAAGAACALGINLLAFADTAWAGDVAESLREGAGRGAAGAGIVAGCGSLALLILARINRRVEFVPEEGSTIMRDLLLVCPRCNRKQRMVLGGGVCAGCGLRIEVRIEEPRCVVCGYLLYKLTSGRCPECGTAIGAAPPNAPVPSETA